MKTVEFDIGIKVNIDPENLGAGTIQTRDDLYGTCPACGCRNCIWSCDGSHLGQVETEATVSKRLMGNASIDALVAVILGHACAGVNVDSAEYREGIQTAIDAIGNSA